MSNDYTVQPDHRPSLVVPLSTEGNAQPGTYKRQRSTSEPNPTPAPSPKRSFISPETAQGILQDQVRDQVNLEDEQASAILLEKKPKSRRWMQKKARPRKWTQEEDTALNEAVSKHGPKNWKHIAEFVPNRNHTQCLQRWGKVLAPNLVKGHWTADEDSNLIDFVKELAIEGMVKNWGEVANMIPGRTSKQCRERWFNHLDPSIKRGNYTQEEDGLILTEQARIGNRWSIISAMLPGRTEDAVKIRWKTLDRERRNSNAPKNPRKPRKQSTQQQGFASNMSTPDRATRHPSFNSPPSPFPISNSVRSLIGHGAPDANSNLLKVETALGNEFLDWTQQMDALANHPQTHTNSNISSWHQTSGMKCIKPEVTHRYRAESLEWLEDALLSPVFKGATPKTTPVDKGAMLAKSSLQVHGSAAKAHEKQSTQLQAAGLRRQLSSELIELAQSGHGAAPSLPLQPLQPHQFTPPQTCHQAARMNSVALLPCINPPNMIKDEDLDHFLTDMDLENLGGALEHRLSFG